MGCPVSKSRYECSEGAGLCSVVGINSDQGLHNSGSAPHGTDPNVNGSSRHPGKLSPYANGKDLKPQTVAQGIKTGISSEQIKTPPKHLRQEVGRNLADSVKQISPHLIKPSIGEHAKDVDQAQTLDEEIAIVGIGCRTPGAENQWEFWRLLENKECHVGDVPSDRWNASAYYAPMDKDGNNVQGKAYVQKGGFIKDVRSFDNLLYQISDYEAAQIDPQQTMLLECTTMALEDAGFTRRDIAGSRTGVYVGSMHHDYASTFIGQVSVGDQYTASGITNTIIASRLSYAFDLRGPCMVLDTACSVSLVAVHQGCLGIRSGDCDMAICGGVNCLLTPGIFTMLCEARMISPTGQCHAFSKDADGYTRAEGCGVVILKRLKDAIRDGDKIYATVYTGTNQDGRTVTPMLQPSGQQQLELLRDVYSRHNIDATRIQYFEAHGTGTPVGDPVEANALGTFIKERGHKGTVYMGSVKTNIGHTEAAAGVLGIIKVLLMMKNNKIVPSLHCNEVNPKINLKQLALAIPREAVNWDLSNKMAGCNSFGFGGSNAHAILKEYTAKSHQLKFDSRKRMNNYHLVCFSGNTENSLKGSLKQFIEDPHVPTLDIGDVAQTSTKHRDHFPFRAAFAAKDMTDLLMSVKEKLDEKQWLPCGHKPRIVFVFCGMSTAWHGMCREMLEGMPDFKEALMEVDKHLKSYVDWSLIHRLQTENPCDDPILAPVAIFATQVGLAAMWRKMGIKPDCVLGQSIGEIAAAYTAGCISLADAVSIIYYRSKFLSELSGTGEMIVVKNIEVEKVLQTLDTIGNKNASIALEYSPRACAISADSETMTRIKPIILSKLIAKNAQTKLISLDVAVPYHSHHVESAAEKFKKNVRQIRSTTPQVQLVSTVSGDIVTKQLDVDHWADNIKKPVLFRQALAASVRDEHSENVIFLEIGPKAVTKSHMADLFHHKPYYALPSVLPQSEIRCFMETIAEMYEKGSDFDWANFPMSGYKRTDTPRYYFDRADKRTRTETELAICGGYDTLGKRHLFIFTVSGEEFKFKMLLSPLTIHTIRQHMVMSKNIVPGALYAESGLAMARYLGKRHCVVSVDFQQILVLEKDEVVEADILLQNPDSVKNKSNISFNVNRKGQHHATITLSTIEFLPRERVNLDHLRLKLTQKATKDKIHSMLKRLGFEHGPAFSLLEEGISDSKEECLTTMRLHDIDKSELQATVMHPCIIDCMLQSTILLWTESLSSFKRALPKSFGGLVLFKNFEEKMYVHARVKSKGPKQLIYDLQLLSPKGHVIAEISDFAIQVFSSNQADNEKRLPDMLNSHWSQVKSISSARLVSSKQADKKQSILFVSEVYIKTTEKSGQLIQIDTKKDITFFEKQLRQHCISAHNFDSLVIVFPEFITEKETTESIQAKIVFMCLLIQCIFNVLNEADVQSRVSVTLLTVNAFPSVSGQDTRDINPMATALWGLLRVALYEHAYTNLMAVELQTRDSNLSHNVVFLQSLLCLLSEDDVADFSEVLVTDDAVFVNQIVRNTSDMEIPTERQTFSMSIKDLRENVILVSKNMANLSQLKAISSRPPITKEDQNVSIRVESFSRAPPQLINTRICAQYVLPDKSQAAEDYIVMATEVCGHNKKDANQKLACCCPLAVGPEVVVHQNTTMDCSNFPNYQVGDISRLVVLWKLAEMFSLTQSCTILTSHKTLPVAQLLKMLHYRLNEGTQSNAEIVLIEQLDKKPFVNPCLVSLILMDCEIMSVISKCWENANMFISFSHLFNDDVHALMAHIFPRTEICLLDTKLLFQLHNLQNTIPQIYEFAQFNSAAMLEISKCLHEIDTCEDENDIRALLEFRSFKLFDLSVQISGEKLFLGNGIYIVVGGLTGLGWLCVKFLAENNAGHIAIINRRFASDEQLASMHEVSKHHKCKIKSFEADISNFASLKYALDQIQSLWAEEGQIRGIFTGAAVVHDSAFILMNKSVFEEVLTPKVKGAWNLHLLTRHLPLDYFVMHSSVASVLGSQGQANYSAGNAFLDGLAYHRRHMGLAAQTINWGPLDTGLLADKDQLKESMENMGFHVASPSEVLDMLRVVLLLNKIQTVPVAVNTEMFSQHINNNAPLPYKMRMQLLINLSMQSDDQKSDEQDFSTIKSMGPEQRISKFEQLLSKLVARVLGVDSSVVTKKVNLINLGLNSVSAMTLISKIESSTKHRLAAVDFLSADVSVSALAKALDDRVHKSS